MSLKRKKRQRTLLALQGRRQNEAGLVVDLTAGCLQGDTVLNTCRLGLERGWGIKMVSLLKVVSVPEEPQMTVGSTELPARYHTLPPQHPLRPKQTPTPEQPLRFAVT